MPPHNSGHWTSDGARTSQFEQHLRAVLDYPLGDTSPIAPVTVMANVLGAPEAPEMTMDERVHHLFARMPDAKIHLYRSEEHTSELQSLMRISYAVFCLKKKNIIKTQTSKQ